MHVLFCASTDLKDAKYIRKGNKNLLEVKSKTYDTIAMCGSVVDCKRTRFGVMLTLNDGENFVITAGTFNKNALQDACDILQKFSENKEIYLLIYANPFYKDAIYLNANQDYSVIEVTREVYEKFHEIRKRALTHLRVEEKEKKEEIPPKTEILQVPVPMEISDESKEEGFEDKDIFEIIEMEYMKREEINTAIINFVENLAKERKDNIIGIKEVIDELSKNDNFSSLNINFADKVYELLEMGYFYEPKPGYIKVIK